MEANYSPTLPLGGTAGGEWAAESRSEGHLPWEASMGYEQLLSIQQHQHSLELEQKEAENAHLKACLDFLDGRRGASENLAEALRTQEEAATLLMAAKHKELELMVGLLQLREQQIEDFRQLCEAQRLEVQQLKRRQPGVEAGGTLSVEQQLDGQALHRPGGASKDEHQQLPSEVRRLRLRIEELEAAMGEQHDRSAGLAHELGARAQRVKVLEEQVKVMRSPGPAWHGALRSPSCSDVGLSGAPQGSEVSPGFGAGSGSVAGSYVVDTFGSGYDVDQTRVVGPYVQHQHAQEPHQQHGNRLNAHHNGHHGQHQLGPNALSPSLALPPLQMSRSAARATGNDAAAVRATVLLPSHQYQAQALLAGGGPVDEAAEVAAAAYLLARNTERRGMGEEAHAVGAATASVLRSRTRQHSPLPGRKGMSHSHGNDSGLQPSHQPALVSPAPAGGAAAAPAHGSTLDAMALRRLGEEHLRPSPSRPDFDPLTMDLTDTHFSLSGHSHGVQSFHSAVRIDPLGADVEPILPKSPYSSSQNAGVSEAAETSRQSQELLSEMRRLRLQMSELERAAGGRHATPSSSGGNGDNNGIGRQRGGADRSDDSDGLAGDPLGAGGVAVGRGVERFHAKDGGVGHSGPLASLSVSGASGASSSAVQSTRSDRGAGWEYRPHASGDSVDAAVALLVNRPGRYRGWRALLCRLEQGVYLCGTRKVHLRVDVEQEKIEASDDAGATWSDLEHLMNGAEASQRALLERARDGAGLAA